MEPPTFSLRLFAILLLFGIVKSGEYIQLESGNIYYVHRSPQLNWYDAKKLCTDHNMTLITPDTEEGQMDVSTIYEKFHFEISVWSSGQANGDLNFVWTTTGNNLNYTNWSVSEPNRDGVSKTQCLVITMEENHYWFSMDCYISRSVICEESPLNKRKEIDVNFPQIMERYHDLEIELNETKHKNEDLQTRIQEISKNQSLAIEFLENKKNLEIDNIKKDLNAKQHENEDLQIKIQEISKNESLSIKLFQIEKNLEIDTIKKFYNKKIDVLANEIVSLKQYGVVPSNETGNSKKYYLKLNINSECVSL